MKGVLLIAAIAVCLGACRKGKYQCQCTDVSGSYGDQLYTIAEEDHSVARMSCDRYQQSLSSGGNTYSCDLR